MQPAAHGLRGAVRHEEETPDRDEADVATLAAMFPHVPAPVLRRTLTILATLAPGDGPPALPADPTTVFTTACPVSPPKSPFALSRMRH